MKKKISLIVSGLIMTGLLAFLLPTAFAQNTTPPTPAQPGNEHSERHPAIHHAIHALEAAKKDMQAAAHDFGGHRVDALAACDNAIAQLKLALQYDKK
ncbi:MAG: hypothetical protein WAO02_01825 [Verrucomicrobiia bacterium]